ncbi:MAG: hypothetical protein GY796_25850 [Chloroflexi bacterium]|nr:hypothetical protein [Chloroflexota bacterium]
MNEREDIAIMPNDLGMELASMKDLAGFMEATSHQDLWVYNPGDLLLIVIAQLFAIASVFFEDILNSLFG